MKKWIRGTNALVMTLAVIGIFIVANIFISSLKGLQWDLTKNHKYTLSSQTLSVLKNLDQSIHVIVFSGGQADPYEAQQIANLLNQYKQHTGKISVDEYDMEKKPSLAKTYNVSANGMVVLEQGKQKKNVYFYDLFLPGSQQGTYQFVGEEKITQAIMNLTSTEKYPVYFVSGNGEIPYSKLTTLTDNLQGENFVPKEVNLLQTGKVPDDAKVVVIAGAQNDLSDKETQIIQDYLKKGGKLYLALSVTDQMDKWPNIDKLMGQYGIENQKAVAVDLRQSSYVDPLTIIPEYGSQEIVSQLSDNNMVTIMPGAVSLKAQDSKDWQDSVLLKTGAEAYGETDFASLQQNNYSKGNKDINGPLNLAYAVSAAQTNTPQAIIVGSSLFMMDSVIEQQANRDYTLNGFAWLLGQKNKVTIRAQVEDQPTQAIITPGQANLIFYGNVLIIPLFFLLLGGWVWWRRRRG
ncbi:MAG: ABC transporter [Paenibacillus sp. RIFOXYA1_FULL_44_5]|nr:MAG: ABC transporter [Paenibacillus sp. RIFOXYA1_FULL_44_5]